MLEELFKKNRCDKLDHYYFEEYEKTLEPLKDKPINILEIGIWMGTSHKTWHQYLPNAQIYGIDIFSRMTPEEVPILSEERVHWARADSTHSQVEWLDVKFDIIIDDGKHTPEANARTFYNFIDQLKPDGIYYIEDVWNLEEDIDHSWVKQHPEDYNEEKWNYFLDALDGYNVETIDFRKKSGKPDSFMYKVTKQ